MAIKALKPPSKQKLLYQQAWLRAHADPEGLKLHFKTRAGAFEARRHLYEAVRDAKTHPMDFKDLAIAAEAIQIVWDGEADLWMRHRDTNDATTGLEDALGVKMDELQDPAAVESERMLMELLAKGSTPVKGEEIPLDLKIGHQDNPFFPNRGK